MEGCFTFQWGEGGGGGGGFSEGGGGGGGGGGVCFSGGGGLHFYMGSAPHGAASKKFVGWGRAPHAPPHYGKPMIR